MVATASESANRATGSDSDLVDYPSLRAEIGRLRERFQKGDPYPHVVIEDFLGRGWAQQAVDEFPHPDSGEWIHYYHVNERKLGRNKIELMPPTLRTIIQELNSPQFVRLLSDLTGIKGLIADPSLEGGGLHQTPRGGFLNIHTDFSVHPHHAHWRRRVNLIVYLNSEWRDEYGGHLELWNHDMSRCEKKVAPLLNRAVIFDTTGDSFHGHPEPLTCPEGMTRRSIALYYFTEEEAPKIRATDYRARPGDGLHALWIYADKLALRLYDRLKRRMGWDDKRTSELLAKLARLTGRDRR